MHYLPAPPRTEAPSPHCPQNLPSLRPQGSIPGELVWTGGGLDPLPSRSRLRLSSPPTALLSTTDAGGGRRPPPAPWKVSTVLSAFRIKKPVSESCSSPNQTNSQVKKHSGISLHTKQPPASPPSAARGCPRSRAAGKERAGRGRPPGHRTAALHSYCFIKNRNGKQLGADGRALRAARGCGSRPGRPAGQQGHRGQVPCPRCSYLQLSEGVRCKKAGVTSSSRF